MTPPPASSETLATRRKWRWQIGLRTWLVLLTLLCIWLGWWVSAAQRQKRAVQALGALDVTYTYRLTHNHFSSRRPALSSANRHHHWLGIDFWYPVVAVRTFSHGPVGHKDEILAAIKDLPELESVSLPDMPITNDDLYRLRHLRHLKTLYLHQSQVKEGNCDALRGMKLVWLSFHRSRFDDRGLAALQDMKTLEHLDLTRTKVTDAGLVYLEGHTNLEDLRLNRSLVTKEGYEKLQKKLPGCDIRWEPLVKP